MMKNNDRIRKTAARFFQLAIQNINNKILMIIKIGNPKDKRFNIPKMLGGMYAFIIVPNRRTIIMRWKIVKISLIIPIYWILSRFFLKLYTNKYPINAPPICAKCAILSPLNCLNPKNIETAIMIGVKYFALIG